jgi:hypothetical protein
MSDDRLGDRVTVADLSDSPIQGGLPHPQQDPWRNAAGVDQPFRGAAPAPGQRRLGAETSYDPGAGTLRDPLAEAQEARRSAAQPQPAAPAPAATKPEPKGVRPVPQVAKASRKETNTLRRFREVFGLQRIKVIDAPLTRRDPNDSSQNVEMVFGLRGINYEDYQWVLEKTQELMQTPALATFAWKIAFMSMGVAAIDKQPIWEVLGFEPDNADHVRDPMYPHMGLRFQAAEAFCEELRTTLFDTVEHLYAAYEEKVDSNYLAKKADKKKEEEGSQGPLTQSGSES